MRVATWVLVSLGFAASMAACGGDDQKKTARADGGEANGGAAGDASSGSNSPAGKSGNTEGGSPDSNGAAGHAAVAGGGAPDDGAGGEAITFGGDGNVPGTALKLHGLVVGANEYPLAGVAIEVQGQNVQTAADGTFEVDATTPYDLVIRGSDGSEAYLGLTRANPKLYATGQAVRGTTLSGVLSGGVGFPVPANHQAQITARGGIVSTFLKQLNAGSAGAWTSDFPVSWIGPTTMNTTVLALQVNQTTNTIVGMGSKEVTLTDKVPSQSPDGDIALSAVTFHDFTLKLTKHSDTTLTFGRLSVGAHTLSVANPGATEVYQVPDGVPDVVGLSLAVNGTTPQGGIVYGLVKLPGAATSASMNFVAPPTLVSPVENATISNDIVFGFTPRGNGMSRLDIRYTEFQSGGEIQIDHTTAVYTNDKSVTLARLLALKLDLSADTPSEWQVTTYSDVTDVNAYTAPSHVLELGHVRSLSELRHYGPSELPP